MNDRDVVNAFVAYLREHGHAGLQVERRPEDENRNSSDIDVVAGDFAIEHTSVDTLPNQRRDCDWFMQAVGGLEQELSGGFSFRLNIRLEYDAVTKGQDWAAIRQALKRWITNEAGHLADGPYVLEAIPGIPFPLHVVKASNRRPAVIFARGKPDEATLPERILKLLDRKAKKLAKYHGRGKITVLLVESDDLAVMNEGKMLGAIQEAYPDGLPAEVDQIWYADTSIPREIEFRNFTVGLQKDSPLSSAEEHRRT